MGRSVPFRVGRRAMWRRAGEALSDWNGYAGGHRKGARRVSGVLRWILLLALLLVFPGVAGVAEGAEPCSPVRVFVDGLPLEPGAGVKYTGVDVTVSADGAVHISTGPGSAREDLKAPTGGSGQGGQAGSGSTTVEGSADPRILDPQAGLNAALPGRYWLVVQDVDGRPSGWSVEVKLNGRSLGTFVSGEAKVIEVTSDLRKGENTAELTYRLLSTGGTVSHNGVFQVILAPGKVAEGAEEIALGYPIVSQQRSSGGTAGTEVVRFELPPPILP